jgi:hypothetical protein
MEFESNMKKTLSILTVLSIVASSILFATPSQAAANDVSTVSASSAASILNSSSNGINIVPGSEVKYGLVKSFTSVDFGTNFQLSNSGIFLTSDSSLGAITSGIPTRISTIMANALIGSGTSSITDLSALSFDFTVSNPSVNSVYLDFLFVTREMNMMTYDVAGFIVDGTNYAYLANSSLFTSRITTSSGFNRNQIGGQSPIYGYQTSTLVGLLDPTLTTHNIVVLVSDTKDTGVPSMVMVSGLTGSTSNSSGYRAFGTMTPAAFTPIPTVTSPTAPTSVVATATGKRSATVSFAAPASNGGSAVTSYTVTSTPGGFTQTLTQATGGTFAFDGLQPATAYTFAVTASNAIGTSAAATSNSVTTTPLVVAALSSLSFADDGTGTGGKIVWSGKSIDAVLYTGSAAYYPGPYNYGAFTGSWNGRIRNLTPGTEYTVSLFVVSADGVGESKSLTFKTSATLPALAGVKSATISRADQMATQLPKLFAWINENVFVEGEGDRMKMMLNKFDALVTSPHRSHIKVPTSRVLSVVATSLTPLTCSVVSATAKENAGLVKALSGDTCTISYTVSGGSRAPATMVKDFVFKKFAK